MILNDVLWAIPVNILSIECECGIKFAWLSNYSLCECPNCHKKEWWHSDGVFFNDEFKVMDVKII